VVLADRQLLFNAIASSLLLHATFLSIRFVSPDDLQFKPVDRGLEIILMNTADQRVPMQADLLAQVNLNGGGNAERGRATSPLPDAGHTSDGALLETQRQRVAQLEQQQARMLAQITVNKAEHALPRPEQARASEPGISPETEASASVLARREAEIARDIADYNKRPIKTQLTPTTRRVEYAMYYTALQQRIEQTGTQHFP